MDNITVKVQVKTNSFFKNMVLVAVFIKSKKLMKYFATKWVRSTRFKIGVGPWEYVDKQAVLDWKWEER